MWKLRSTHLEPRFRSTDVLAALLLASQIFNRQPSEGERRMLVRFSDMRDYTRDSIWNRRWPWPGSAVPEI